MAAALHGGRLPAGSRVVEVNLCSPQDFLLVRGTAASTTIVRNSEISIIVKSAQGMKLHSTNHQSCIGLGHSILFWSHPPTRYQTPYGSKYWYTILVVMFAPDSESMLSVSLTT